MLATKSINRRETVNALDRIGLSVYVTEQPPVEEMVVSVEHIGSSAAGKPAAEVAGDLRRRLLDLNRRLAGTAPRRVLFVVWTDPLISVGRDTFIADALRLAGGRSVVNTKAEWPHISLEEIVRLQPEALVFASAHAGDTQRDIEALRTRPGWKSLEAMEHGNVVVVSDAINRPAPRMVDAIERLARALHPGGISLAAPPREAVAATMKARGLKPALLQPADSNAGMEEVSRMRPLTIRRLLWTCGGLAVLLLASVVLALKLGAVPISVTDLVVDLGRIAIGRANELPTEYRLITDLRLPRILLGILVGAALSVAGASQALLRTRWPILCWAFQAARRSARSSDSSSRRGLHWLLHWAHLLAPWRRLQGVYFLGRREGAAGQHDALAGRHYFRAIFSAIIMFLMTTLTGRDLRGMVFWLMGDLSTPVSSTMVRIHGGPGRGYRGDLLTPRI